MAVAENTPGFCIGHFDAYTTVDLGASYTMNKKFSACGAVKRLTDERTCASLQQGVYVGPERSVEVGAKCSF